MSCVTADGARRLGPLELFLPMLRHTFMHRRMLLLGNERIDHRNDDVDEPAITEPFEFADARAQSRVTNFVRLLTRPAEDQLVQAHLQHHADRGKRLALGEHRAAFVLRDPWPVNPKCLGEFLLRHPALLARSAKPLAELLSERRRFPLRLTSCHARQYRADSASHASHHTSHIHMYSKGYLLTYREKHIILFS